MSGTKEGAKKTATKLTQANPLFYHEIGEDGAKKSEAFQKQVGRFKDPEAARRAALKRWGKPLDS